MLVRRITAHWATESELAISRIDFDYVNPDYPDRAPGLLLQILADDLRLIDHEGVQWSLRKFGEQIDQVHRGIESQSRADRSRLGSGYDYAHLEAQLEEATLLFIQALETIAEVYTPVFILDTCEELTRLRPTGELPQALLRTFELLDRLHTAVPKLRVVFSGRWPLTRRSDDVEDESLLEPRDYLRVVPVLGFDQREADALLEKFEDEGRHVDRQLARPFSIRAGCRARAQRSRTCRTTSSATTPTTSTSTRTGLRAPGPSTNRKAWR